MYALSGFRNAAPRFPEKITLSLPKGSRRAIERAAGEKGLTSPELIRRTLAEILTPKKDQ